MNMSYFTSDSVLTRCASVCHSLRFSLCRVNVRHIDTNRNLAFPVDYQRNNPRKRYARIICPSELRTSAVGASWQGPESFHRFKADSIIFMTSSNE